MSSQVFTESAMAELVAQGAVQPLLPDGTPGPVRMNGDWWAIPTGGVAYQVVSAEQAALLDEHARRLTAARQIR